MGPTAFVGANTGFSLLPMRDRSLLLISGRTQLLVVAAHALALGSLAWAAGNRDPHWAFRKPNRPSVPEVKNRDWVRSPIDAWVLAKLEARRLSPAPSASKPTLVRRAY